MSGGQINRVSLACASSAGRACYVILPSGLLKLTPGDLRYRQAVATLHRIVDELVAERRAAPEPGTDLLGILLTATGDDEQPLSDREVRDNIIAMLTAGIETVGSVTEWAVWMLADHPEQQQRLHEEVNALGHLPEPADLPHLDQTRNELSEAMRVHSAVWMLNRKAIADLELGGYRIPAGADILYSPYILHRDQRSFPHPERFDPDRWTPERAASAPRNAFIPFAIGSRKCPADHYSMCEITLLLATVAARWRLEGTGQTDPTPLPRITLHPRRPVLRVQPQHPDTQLP